MKRQTDTILKYCKPDIVVFEKKSRSCKVVGVSWPFNIGFVEKEEKKGSKYQEQNWKLKRIWNRSKMTVLPVIIGALGTICEEFHSWLHKTSPASTSEHYKRPIFCEEPVP